MISNAYTTEIIKYLSSLEKKEQNKVLNYVKVLASKRKEEKPDFMKYFGSIEKEDIELMEKAVDEDCGKIDYNEW